MKTAVAWMCLVSATAYAEPIWLEYDPADGNVSIHTHGQDVTSLALVWTDPAPQIPNVGGLSGSHLATSNETSLLWVSGAEPFNGWADLGELFPPGLTEKMLWEQVESGYFSSLQMGHGLHPIEHKLVGEPMAGALAVMGLGCIVPLLRMRG